MRNSVDIYKRIHSDVSIPQEHIEYLSKIEFEPNVIFDIGSNALHWHREANKTWPNSKIYCFEAIPSFEDFYIEMGVDYNIGVLSDSDNRQVRFWQNEVNTGGSSYYKENSKYSRNADVTFTVENSKMYPTSKLDTIVRVKELPKPDMIKIDVQGCEVDVLKGATETLLSVKHLIVELQHVEYNIGANLIGESLPFIESLGFKLVPNETSNQYFCSNGPDADYHFIKIES